jgi:hypothetical protein
MYLSRGGDFSHPKRIFSSGLSRELVVLRKKSALTFGRHAELVQGVASHGVLET